MMCRLATKQEAIKPLSQHVHILNGLNLGVAQME